MDLNTFVGLWILSGMIYTLINGLFRNIYTDDDMLLPMGHIFLGPIFIGTLIGVRTSRRFRKWLNDEGFKNHRAEETPDNESKRTS